MGLLYDWFKLFHWRSLLTFTSFPIFTSRCQYKISNVCRNSPQQIPSCLQPAAQIRTLAVNQLQSGPALWTFLSLSQGFCSDTTPFSFMVAHLELTRWPLKDSAAQPASSKVAVQSPCWSKIIYAVNFLPHQNERRCIHSGMMIEWVFFSWVGGLRRHKKGVFPWTCQKCAKLPCGIMTESVDSVRFHTSSLLLFLSASTAPLFASVLFFSSIFFHQKLSLFQVCLCLPQPLFHSRIRFWQCDQMVPVTEGQNKW